MSNSAAVITWRKNLKQRALALFGHKCSVCGYSRCAAALEFHHLDPSKKEFSLSNVYANPKKWSEVVEELEKCVLLCANCHREVHQNILHLDSSKKYIIIETDYRLAEKTHHTCTCGSVIRLSEKYCSTTCYNTARVTRDWFKEKEAILYKRDVLKLAYTTICKDYGVSDVTIRRWYNKFKHSQ